MTLRITPNLKVKIGPSSDEKYLILTASIAFNDVSLVQLICKQSKEGLESNLAFTGVGSDEIKDDDVFSFLYDYQSHVKHITQISNLLSHGEYLKELYDLYNESEEEMIDRNENYFDSRTYQGELERLTHKLSSSF